jgi:hypothetical protein
MGATIAWMPGAVLPGTAFAAVLGLLLVPGFALIAVTVALIASAAAVMGLVAAIVAAPYLLGRALGRRRQARRGGGERTAL